MFLLGNLALGLVLCFADTTSVDFLLFSEFGHAFPYACGVILLATSVARRTPIYVRIPAFLLGVAAIALLVQDTDIDTVDIRWIGWLALATGFLAGVVSTLRLCGFRVVNLTDGISSLEIEKRTGRDLDDWIAVLHDGNAASLKHAEIMAFIRQYGVEYSWQKTVTVAYERAIGRHSVLQSADGTPQVVVQQMHSEVADSLTCLTQQRFNIRRLMLGTFCIACLLGFARVFGTFSPPGESLQ